MVDLRGCAGACCGGANAELVPGQMGKIESVGIRRAEASDIAALRRVEAAALASTHSHPASGRNWEVLFEDGRVFTYLAEDDEPFGFVTAGTPREEWFDDGITGEIISLCVLPDYRNHGIGRRLLVHGMSVLKRRDFASALIWLREDAGRGRELIESTGFTAVDSVRTVNLADGEISERAWTMSLENFF